MKFYRVIAPLLALALAACAVPNAQTPPPARPPKAPTRPVKPSVSDDSIRLKAYFAALEARLIAKGKLRTDYAPADAPFDEEDLVRNFNRIALYDEYKPDSAELVEEQTISYLRRWEKPIRVGIYFGNSVDKAQRAKDRREVRSFAQRLAAITGLNIQMSGMVNANFIVTFLNRDELLTEPELLSATTPQFVPDVVQGLAKLPDEIYCIAYGLFDTDNQQTYSGAVIMIKAEHSPRMRQSCIQEEMTQALGLANDDPDTRPSIFNDDEEFALLTKHDEILLKMLYDPRLRVGMTPKSQQLTLRQVAKDALKQSRI